MLSLFKLPFWERDSNKDTNRFPAGDLSRSIYKNYLSRQNFSSDVKHGEVQEFIESEFRSLHQSLNETPSQDQYDLIKASLRRIDDRLKRVRQDVTKYFVN